MKNIYFKFSALFIVAAVLFSSCSRNNSVVSNHRIQKRKYNSGFHTELHKKNKSEDVSQKIEKEEIETIETISSPIDVKEKTNSTPKQIEVVTEVSTDRVPLESQIETSTTNSANTIEQIEEPSAPIIGGSSLTESKNKNTKAAEKILKKLNKKSIKKKAMRIDSIVYILLCIFIPFVAVGLATSWDPLKTVLALVLTICFWLPGIIYAFLVCNQEGVI